MQKKSGRGDRGGNSTQPPRQKATPQTREEQQPKSDANTEALLRSVQQQENEELSRMNKPARRKAHVGW